MIDSQFLDLVEEVARKIRGSTAAFGGLQVVFCGDFHQLPPVNTCRAASQNPRFCFESKAWAASNLCCIQLTQVFRQVIPRNPSNSGDMARIVQWSSIYAPSAGSFM